MVLRQRTWCAMNNLLTMPWNELIVTMSKLTVLVIWMIILGSLVIGFIRTAIRGFIETYYDTKAKYRREVTLLANKDLGIEAIPTYIRNTEKEQD